MNLAVEVSNLSKGYAKKLALENFSLRLPYGCLYAAVGGNGSGKTTTLKLLAGLLACDGGQGTVLGLDLRRQASQIRCQVGYMSQQYALYATLTVWENLYGRAMLYALPNPAQAASRLLQAFSLQPYREMAVGGLSGGWMRKLQLACALLASPPLLLLDEPTAGLDIQARREMWQVIRHQCQEGAAVLVSTHDLDQLSGCDQVTVFADGRVLAQEAPAQLMQAAEWLVFASESLDESWPGPAFQGVLGNSLRLVRKSDWESRGSQPQPLGVGAQDAVLAITTGSGL